MTSKSGAKPMTYHEEGRWGPWDPPALPRCASAPHVQVAKVSRLFLSAPSHARHARQGKRTMMTMRWKLKNENAAFMDEVWMLDRLGRLETNCCVQSKFTRDGYLELYRVS